MLDAFRDIVVVDTEFTALPGERPGPVCLVARELRSGRRFRLWLDGLKSGVWLPFATGPDVLFIAYYASAELGCYRVLGLPMPERILDLFVEFRNLTNGLPTPAGAKLLGALTYFGLDAAGAIEKKEMQETIGSDAWRGRFTPEEILDYCGGTSTPSSACCRPCCRALTCPGPCCAGAPWPPLPPWSTTAPRPTSRR